MTMGSVRFSRIEMKYGCHDRNIKIPIKQGPVVIAARNGCGKTTFVEALVRAVFGFDPDSLDDQRIIESRRPWAGDEMRLAVELVSEEWGTWNIDRDICKSRIAITSPAGEKRSWREDANDPVGISGRQQIREELIALFGFDDRLLYENTSCLHQGELLRTNLSDEILRVAESTYAQADAARLRLAAAAQSWQTGHPSGDEEPDADRQSIAELEERIAELETSLAQAGESGARHRSLSELAENLENDLDKVEEEIELLERERKPLLSQHAEELEIEKTRERLSDLESIEQDLERALANVESVAKDGEPVTGPSQELPGDFNDRAQRIEELWEDRKNQRIAISKRREDLQSAVSPSPALIVVATLLAFTGLPAWQAGLGSAAIALTLLGLAAVAVLLVRRRAAAGDRNRLEGEIEGLNSELRATKEKLSELVADIPDGENLRRDRLLEMAREFDNRGGEQSRIDGASEELVAVSAIARGILEKWSKAAIPTQPRQILNRLQKAIISVREELGGRTAEIEASRQDPSVSDAAVSSLEALEITIRERHQARNDLLEKVAEAQRAVVEEGRLSRSPLATQREIVGARLDLEKVRKCQVAFQWASELIDAAYEEYREQDEQRLVDAISHALAGLSSGEMGPLIVENGVENLRLRVDQRELPIACPPLGYGEYHAALLAIRIGGAGFLSNLGIRPPFIVDEPFTYLDESHCVQLWQILNRIARDRQVIVATYNHMLLDQIGVAPDVVLDQPPAHALFAAR